MTKVVFVNKGSVYSPEKDRLISELKDIFSIIEDSHFSYEIWWILVSEEGRKKHFRQMLHYKEFFQPTAYAHIISFVINLYKLFETRKDVLSLKKITKDAERLGFFDATQIKRESEEVKGIWIKIGILRNKLFAHKNYHLTIEDIYREARINPNQIKRLIELSLIIFNALWRSLGMRPKTIEEFSTRDTRKVLEDLSRLREFRRHTTEFGINPTVSRIA